ncbi:MAG: cytochrome c [Erythrobacter sp.]|uniref:c-type cytochrome n=1 Tax=Erythrobacter sp. TaxID=1042 RepID=UPI0025EF05F9|nr:c-type cytochrome [Erythrobacter sp.]MCL9999754.1 cytochrome c [Erythrobacter sp.]
MTLFKLAPALLLALLVGLAGCSQPSDTPAAAPGPLRFERASADPVKHGERLSQVLGCSGCHGDDLTGQDWSDAMGTLWTANLTQSAAKFSHDDLAAMITTGKWPGRALMDMPSFLYTGPAPADVDALVAYLKSLPPSGAVHPEPSMSEEFRAMQARGEWMDSPTRVAAMSDKGPPDLGEAHAFGHFIIRATCVECHGMDLAGGKEAMEDEGNPPPDLRIVGSYSAEGFAALMRTGTAAGGREVGLMSKVARRRYANFTDAEVAAVRAYLVELANRDL